MKISLAFKFVSALMLSATLGTAVLAASNEGAPSLFSRYETQTRALPTYEHSLAPSQLGAFSIESVGIGPAELTVTQVRDTICGSSESGYAGCTQSTYTTEPAVVVHVLLENPGASSEQSGSDMWTVYFRLSEFSKAELAAIHQNDVTFDPFGSANSRSRTLARQLFQVSTRPVVKTWKEAVYGNVCHDESSAGEQTARVCNVIGETTKSRTVNGLVISKR